MINLIVSDLDGTLLPKGSQQLDPAIFPLIKALKEKGILFVAASGRQYSNIRRMFAPVNDDIAYICENGSLVIYKGEILYKKTIERELALEVLHAIWEKENAEILISGEDISYIKPKSEYYYHLINDVVKNNVCVVDDIFSIKENLLKISLYERNGIRDSQYWLERFSNQLTVAISGLEWLDITPLESNKGKALDFLLNKLNISPENTMAFGDQNNDIEMLKYVKYGVAMNDKVRKYCNYQTDQVERILSMLCYNKGKFYEYLKVAR